MAGKSKFFNLRAVAAALVIVAAFIYARQAGKEEIKYYQEVRLLMGTEVGIGVAGMPDEEAKVAIKAAFEAMEAVDAEMGRYEGRPLYNLDKAGGGHVSHAMAEVIARSLKIAEKTGGAFDPTVAPLVDLWDVKSGAHQPPTKEQISQTLRKVGYRKVMLDESNRSVDLGGAELELGGIAKGYAVDMGVKALETAGVANFIINAGGDIYLKGVNNTDPWKVGVQDPRKEELYKILKPLDGAVVTSGDYESFFVYDDVYYHHIIDPHTGYPAPGVASVTVWAKNATDADAYATAAFVLGIEEGIAMLETIPDVEGLMLVADGRFVQTSNFEKVTRP